MDKDILFSNHVFTFASGNETYFTFYIKHPKVDESGELVIGEKGPQIELEKQGCFIVSNELAKKLAEGILSNFETLEKKKSQSSK